MISIFNETFVFLINIFVPVIPVLLISLIYDSVRRVNFRKTGIISTARGLLKNITAALIMMLVSRVIYLNFFSHLPQGRFNLLSMLLVFFVMSSASRIFTGRKMYIAGILVVIVNIIMLYIQTGKEMLGQIYSVGLLAFIVILFRIFYESVLKYLDVEIVRAERLKPGDSLSKEFIAQNKLDKGEMAERLGDMFMDGLTNEQLSVLREYIEENKIEYVERQRTFSFSAYIVIGYAFTYFTGFGNIILTVRRLLGF